MAYPSTLLLFSCLVIVANYASTSQGMNIIDSCWRSNPNWASNRQALANCAIGFGKNAMGGKNGKIYVVTDASDNPGNPLPGTLRYGAIQNEPIWIVFEKDMVITLENELLVSSYKTIDGRGAKVEIANGPCIGLYNVTNVIIHGISIHDCKPSPPTSDGDAITVAISSDVWIDHCYLARCADGLVDVVLGSTSVTISNNYFTQHDKVMLLGNNDNYSADRDMKTTVVFNYFGPQLGQRMPRARFGYVHVVNNKYEQWEDYAIGGSADPTILSEGNYFVASNNPYTKEVTRRENGQQWKNWSWTSCKDVFENGAFFVPSGTAQCHPIYSSLQSFQAANGSLVPTLVSEAGPLTL